MRHSISKSLFFENHFELGSHWITFFPRIKVHIASLQHVTQTSQIMVFLFESKKSKNIEKIIIMAEWRSISLAFYKITSKNILKSNSSVSTRMCIPKGTVCEKISTQFRKIHGAYLFPRWKSDSYWSDLVFLYLLSLNKYKNSQFLINIYLTEAHKLKPSLPSSSN